MSENILRQTEHRPWPLPSGPWVMAQSWRELLFAHWRIPVEALRPLVPAELELETWDGSAWLGVVPFLMAGVRPRGVPALPRLSAFPEINVRTYVKVESKPGAWFLSLDAANSLAVALARRAFHLPYFHADMRQSTAGEWTGYQSRRRHLGALPAAFEARYRPDGPAHRAEPGSLEYFLIERYCLYALDGRGRLLRREVQHAPWQVQPAQAGISVNSMVSCDGLHLPDEPPLLHFSRRIDVLIWRARKVVGGRN